MEFINQSGRFHSSTEWNKLSEEKYSKFWISRDLNLRGGGWKSSTESGSLSNSNLAEVIICVMTGIEQRLSDAYHIGILQQKEIIKLGRKR